MILAGLLGAALVVQGRPRARHGWVQRRAILRRRQRSKVSGATSQPARCGRDRAAATAPTSARSSSARAGRLFYRRRTASWWRNTMISRSFERPERTAKRANDTSNRYRMRHIGPQDASASCLVSAHDRIVGTHSLGATMRGARRCSIWAGGQPPLSSAGYTRPCPSRSEARPWASG